MDERFNKREKKLFYPNKKKLISLFRTPTAKATLKEKSQISLLKAVLIQRPVEEMFRNSWSQNGSIRLGTISEILTMCLEPLAVVTDEPLSSEAVIINVAALVNMLRPKTIGLFDEYADTDRDRQLY